MHGGGSPHGFTRRTGLGPRGWGKYWIHEYEYWTSTSVVLAPTMTSTTFFSIHECFEVLVFWFLLINVTYKHCLINFYATFLTSGWMMKRVYQWWAPRKMPNWWATNLQLKRSLPRLPDIMNTINCEMGHVHWQAGNEIATPGPCLTTAILRNPSNQWQRSFQRKLRSHWLKLLRQRHVAVVRQSPGRVSDSSESAPQSHRRSLDVIIDYLGAVLRNIMIYNFHV